MKINTPKLVYGKEQWVTEQNNIPLTNANLMYSHGSLGLVSNYRVLTDGVQIYRKSNLSGFISLSVEKDYQQFDVRNHPIISMAYGELEQTTPLSMDRPAFIGIANDLYYYILTVNSQGVSRGKVIANTRSITPDINNYIANQIIWGDNQFVLFGDGFIETCSEFASFDDGTVNFVRVADAPEWYYEKCIYANGLYVAYINNNKKNVSPANVQGFSVSSDGEEWTTISSVPEINTTNGTKINLAYADGKYIAITSDGVKAVSSDGENWAVNDEYIQRVNNVVPLPDMTLSILAGTDDNKTLEYRAKGDDYFVYSEFGWRSYDSDRFINPAVMVYDSDLGKLVLASAGAKGILTKRV